MIADVPDEAGAEKLIVRAPLAGAIPEITGGPGRASTVATIFIVKV
jgi:hypothetical protein